MKIYGNPKRLLAAAFAGSLFSMLTITALTNPLNNIAYALLFFLALIVFLFSGGYLLVAGEDGSISLKNRYRLFVVSLFFTLILMFRSAGALGWLDAAALILITLGLLFYGGRRL